MYLISLQCSFRKRHGVALRIEATCSFLLKRFMIGNGYSSAIDWLKWDPGSGVWGIHSGVWIVKGSLDPSSDARPDAKWAIKASQVIFIQFFYRRSNNGIVPDWSWIHHSNCLPERICRRFRVRWHWHLHHSHSHNCHLARVDAKAVE